MKAKLEKTTDYSMFQSHELNRPLHKTKLLNNSLLKNGFMPSSPLHCVHNGGGKLKILRGHHRFHLARELKLPVYYVVDDTETDIFELEGDSGSHWSLRDFVHARSQAGDMDCQKLLAFQKRHGISLGAAASLVGGDSAASNNMGRAVRQGRFEVGDMKHANDVVRVVDLCRELGAEYATNSAFVYALSSVLRIPELDQEHLMHRLRIGYANVNKRSNREGYMEEIEALYNHAARSKRLPIAFRAAQVGRERSGAKKE